MIIGVQIIKFLHLVLILFILVSVFIPRCYIKEFSLAFLIFIAFQYFIGNGSCGLTKLEYLMLGEKHYQEGFIYRLVKPVVTVPEKYFNNGLLYLHILWVAILVYQIKKNNCSLNPF